MKPMFTSVEGAKSFLCCGTTRLYQLINDGEIRRVKDGGKSLIVLESLELYAKKLITSGTSTH